MTCNHPPTWRVASHDSVRDAHSQDQDFAYSLSCDRAPCLADAALYVKRATGNEPVTRPIGQGAAIAVSRSDVLKAPKRASKAQAQALARTTDPTSAHAAAERANLVKGKHKRAILDWLAENEQNRQALVADTAGTPDALPVHWYEPLHYTARELAEAMYHEETIELREVDTVRRRVHDLYLDGFLERHEHDSEPATYTLHIPEEGA